MEEQECSCKNIQLQILNKNVKMGGRNKFNKIILICFAWDTPFLKVI